MIQFPTLNDALLVYAKINSENPELGRIVELRVSNEFNYDYQAKYFGIYCPTYKLTLGDLDRILIKLPPVESEIVYPIYLERMIRSNMYFDYSFVNFYENMFSPNHIVPRQGSMYHTDYWGMNFVSGKVAVDHEELPVKFKLNIPNVSSHGKFHLYNPDTGYLMWTIEIDGLDIYINDTLEITLSNSVHIELDIGFDANKLRMNAFEDDDLLDYIESSSPLNTMPAVSDTIMEIEGLDELTIDWMLCYTAAFENAKVYSAISFTDFEQLVTSGRPVMTHPHRFGLLVHKSDTTTKELGVERTVTIGHMDRYGMKASKQNYYLHSHPLELKVYNDKTYINAIELIVQNNHIFSNPMQVSVGSLTHDDVYVFKGTKTNLVDESVYFSKISKTDYEDLELGLQRQVAFYDKNYYTFQGTHIKDVYKDAEMAMTTRIEDILKDEELLLIMVKKIPFNVYIETESYEKYRLQSSFTGGMIETE